MKFRNIRSVMYISNACKVGFHKPIVPLLFEKNRLSSVQSSVARQQLESTAMLCENDK
jgi:hypothetical protein